MNYTNGVAADYLSASNILEEISDKYKVHYIRADEAYDIKRVYKEFWNTILFLLFALRMILNLSS